MCKTVNGTTTNFLYNGANTVQEQSAQTGTANILSGGIDEFLMRTDSSGTWSPLLDSLGSSLALTDATGAILTEYSYGAFGLSATSGANNNNSAQYTGRENDGTGLQYNRARYYSSTLQRFISEDPLEFGGGDVNLYGYTANSPTNFTDPSGMAISGVRNRMLNLASRKLNLDYLLGFAANYSAGFGDGLGEMATPPWVSFFAPGWNPVRALRDLTPGGAHVDYNSPAYGSGKDSAKIFVLVTTVAGGAGSAGGAGTRASFDPNRAGHIFRQAPGHVNPSTAASQGRFARLFENVASNPQNARPNFPLPPGAQQAGVQAYTQSFRNGQVWVEVRNSIIQNAGVNPLGGFR